MNESFPQSPHLVWPSDQVFKFLFSAVQTCCLFWNPSFIDGRVIFGFLVVYVVVFISSWRNSREKQEKGGGRQGVGRQRGRLVDRSIDKQTDKQTDRQSHYLFSPVIRVLINRLSTLNQSQFLWNQWGFCIILPVGPRI